MGNRACVVFTNRDESEISPAIYLHWNGGPESIYAFLDEMERRHVRADVTYFAARFTHVVGDYFDSDEAGGLSLGICNGPATISCEALTSLACMGDDNGVYVYNVDTKTMRRFKVRTYASEAVEINSAFVASEKRTAYKHANFGPGGIHLTLFKARPKVER